VPGELPTGRKGGRSSKLFLSFGLDAIVVVSLVVYSYPP
jgi:cytochrome c oxidase subunit 2